MDDSTRAALVDEALAHEHPREHGKRLADQHGLNFGVVWPWITAEAGRRAAQRLPADGLMARLLDDAERARLLDDAEAERTFTLSNRLHTLLRTCPATPEQIRALLAALPPDGSLDHDFDEILNNPAIPEALLFELLDQGRCISRLGHRAGPQRLLERLAEEHEYDEAITTLALSYYGGDDHPLDSLLAFITRHRRCHMLESNLRHAKHLSAERHRAVLALLDTTGTTTLWRPTGPTELALVRDSGWRRWPPRLPDQPIFYPVLNAGYATQIARDWNTKGGGTGYVTRFDVDTAFLSRYQRQVVGARAHEELWVPAEELEDFNDHIVGEIEVVAAYRGDPPEEIDVELP